jgi:hypothetical protein
MNKDWGQLSVLFLFGMKYHGYTIEDDRFGDDLDNSISIRSGIALHNLAQLVDGKLTNKVF